MLILFLKSNLVFSISLSTPSSLIKGTFIYSNIAANFPLLSEIRISYSSLRAQLVLTYSSSSRYSSLEHSLSQSTAPSSFCFASSFVSHSTSFSSFLILPSCVKNLAMSFVFLLILISNSYLVPSMISLICSIFSSVSYCRRNSFLTFYSISLIAWILFINLKSRSSILMPIFCSTSKIYFKCSFISLNLKLSIENASSILLGTVIRYYA